MPKLVHTTPCGGCPFRRKSAPSWLGASTPEEFVDTTLAEFEMPCHLAINYMDKEWEETQYPDAPLCAGALIFMRNCGKLPRDPKLTEAMKKVQQDDSVFAHSGEFLDHHRRYADVYGRRSKS